MSSKSKVVWSIKEITHLLRKRQVNQFDCNIAVTGKRGDGKSTLLFKIFNSFKKEGFKQKKHQVYDQRDIITLLTTQKFGFCWDDEAINSGYKRDFQKSGQKDLIKIVTNYRDNFNIYGSALPFFYSLDKDLRDLIFMHLHVVERGLAVIFLPLKDQIHGQDIWDTKNNQKIEERESKRLEKNPKSRFRYHRLTTFAGYLFFGPMTPKQRALYEEIKTEKRAKRFEQDQSQKEESFMDKTYNMLIDGKLTSEGLIQICLSHDRKYSNVMQDLAKRLRDEGSKFTPSHYLRAEKTFNNNSKESINNLVPPPTP